MQKIQLLEIQNWLSEHRRVRNVEVLRWQPYIFLKADSHKGHRRGSWRNPTAWWGLEGEKCTGGFWDEKQEAKLMWKPFFDQVFKVEVKVFRFWKILCNHCDADEIKQSWLAKTLQECSYRNISHWLSILKNTHKFRSCMNECPLPLNFTLKTALLLPLQPKIPEPRATRTDISR